MTPTMTPTTTPTAPTAHDRCDRCGARGSVRVVLAGGGDLIFCGHHAREYETKIQEVAVKTLTTDDV